MPVFADDDVLVIDILPFSLRADGRVWLGSWLASPILPRVERKVRASVHRPTVIDVDAYEALLADDAAAE